VPTGKLGGDETLFDWIVSDFGPNDAIESGLVKAPRLEVRDDGQLTASHKSRLYYIYMDSAVHRDLTRKAQEFEPLPDLVANGYYLLGKDWLETLKKWESVGFKTPVMIAVTNRIERGARVHYALTHAAVLRLQDEHI
jgi:type III restriction enzyme